MLEKSIIEHPVTNIFGSVYLRPDETLPLTDSKGQKVYVLACSAEGASKIRRQEEGFPACIRRVALPFYVNLFAFFELISLNLMFKATGPAERQLETNGLKNIREGTNFFPLHTEHFHRSWKNGKSCQFKTFSTRQCWWWFCFFFVVGHHESLLHVSDVSEEHVNMWVSGRSYRSRRPGTPFGGRQMLAAMN